MRRLALNLTLLLAACLVGLVLCELSLRFFYPKYEDLAGAEYDLDQFRIWKKTPNSRSSFRHPDTGLSHPYNHNNWGLRQDRDFSEQQLKSAVNLGFFGDSYTENARMAARYSFTEPLDHLMNLQGKAVNVLNFGVDGYGPGQSFLHYKHFPHAKELDHVFYVYYLNDLRNIYETGLFQLDDDGELLQNKPLLPSWWTTFVSRLHVSYLLLDVAQRWFVAASDRFLHQRDDEAEEGLRGVVESFTKRYRNTRAFAIDENVRRGNMDDPDVQDSIAVFQHLMAAWKRSVEANGGRFHIVLVPKSAPRSILPFLGDDFSTINLHGCFSGRGTGWEAAYHFKEDRHWNEAGNRLAAVCLYRFLERETGLPVLAGDEIHDALGRYYAAFEESGRTGGRGQNPIRARYSALNLEYIDTLMAEAGEPVLHRGGWEVHHHAGLLIYSRDGCTAEDTAARFFLHLVPLDPSDLPEARRPHGYDNLDFHFASRQPVAGQCLAVRELPGYVVAEARTGQTAPDGGRLWDALYLTPEVGEPVLSRDGWEVYHSAGRLIYSREACAAEDTAPRFFLHLVPVDPNDLPEDRRPHGYDNLDFDFASRQPVAGQCLAVRELPGYAVAEVRTGQYLPDAGRLWEDRFPLAAPSAHERQAHETYP